jgi:hypothetical protein
VSRSIYVVYRVAVTMELRSFDQCDVERLGEGEDVLDVDGPQIRKASAAHWQAPSKRPSKREYDNGEEVGKVKKKKKTSLAISKFSLHQSMYLTRGVVSTIIGVKCPLAAACLAFADKSH